MNIVIKELDSSINYLQYCALLKQLTTIDSNNFSEADYMRQLEMIRINPRHKIFVAIANDVPVGSITMLVEPKFIHDLSAVGHIEDVVVDQAYRKYGIGLKLVQKAIDFAREMGCYKIILDCSTSNLEFYKKSGFVQKEHQMALYLNK
jgi:glucosamine-phosphate N-acetyltransferase